MTVNGLLQIALFIALLVALARPLGSYMARVYEGKPLGFERLIYRMSGVRPDEEMDWKAYALAVLLFNAASVVVLYALQRLQGVLPLNPRRFGAVVAPTRRSTPPSASPPTPTGRATAARRR